MYQITSKSIFGSAYTLKDNGVVLLSAETSNFYPVLNRTLGGFVVFPHQFTFSDKKSILYRKSGLGKETFVLHTPEMRIIFSQEAAHSYHMTLTGEFSGELYPILTMRKVELRQENILLGVIEKVSDSPEKVYLAEGLTHLKPELLLSLGIIVDCLITIPY